MTAPTRDTLKDFSLICEYLWLYYNLMVTVYRGCEENSLLDTQSSFMCSLMCVLNEHFDYFNYLESVNVG